MLVGLYFLLFSARMLNKIHYYYLSILHDGIVHQICTDPATENLLNLNAIQSWTNERNQIPVLKGNTGSVMKEEDMSFL